MVAKGTKAEQGAAAAHASQFRTRFCRHAFGSKSQSVISRVQQVVAEIKILQPDVLWLYMRWAVRALAVQDRKAEVIRYAEACRGPWASDHDIDGLCEHILSSRRASSMRRTRATS